MKMAEDPTEERRAPRIQVYGKVEGQVSALIAAKLVDLSLSGARLEHRHVLHPGTIYILTIPTGAGQLSIRSRVVWSSVSGSIKTDQGTQLLYQSGLEFLNLQEADREHLASFIASFGSGGGSSL